MAPKRRTDPADAPADFDELLADAPETADAAAEVVLEQGTVNDIPVGEPVATVEPVEAPVALTPAQERLAAARAAKAAREEAARQNAPDEYAGLTPDEIAELQALEADERVEVGFADLARANGGGDVSRIDNSQVGGTGEKILIHVVQDGLTAFGDVWLRGQEIEVEVGTPAYERTKNIHGQSWLDLADDLQGQYAKWGRQYIASGPFIPRPGERFEDAVAQADRRRGRTVPVVANILD